MSIASEITRIQNAKAAMKASINDKGGSVTDETLDDYAAAIDLIETGVDTSDATAAAGDIFDGETAYVNGVKITGTYEELDTSDATAANTDILATKTAYVNGVKITGNLTDYKTILIDVLDGSIHDLSIPSGITLIKEYAFFKQYSLHEIIIPDTVTEIEDNAFHTVANLAKIWIPNDVVTVGANIFMSCPAGTKVYCEAASKPAGWDADWNHYVAGTDLTAIYWGSNIAAYNAG